MKNPKISLLLSLILINSIIETSSIQTRCQKSKQFLIPCLRTATPYSLSSTIGMSMGYNEITTILTDSGSDNAAEQFEEFPAKCLIPATILGTVLFSITDHYIYGASHKQPSFGVFCGSACMNIALKKTEPNSNDYMTKLGQRIQCCRCNKRSVKEQAILEDINKDGIEEYCKKFNSEIAANLLKIKALSASLPAEPIIERADEVISPIENAATPRASLLARCAGSIRRIFRKNSGSNDGTIEIPLLPIPINQRFAQPVEANSTASSSDANNRQEMLSERLLR